MKLQIVDDDGEVLQLRAGGRVELDLQEAITAELVRLEVDKVIGAAATQQRLVDLAKQATVAQGVGLFRTEAKVTHAIDLGLRSALALVATDTTAATTPLVRAAIHQVFKALKRRTVGV